MKDEQYRTEIEKRINTISKLRKEACSIAKGIIGHNLFKEDLFFCSTLDRCMHLMDGFSAMLESRNLTCVGSLLRVQLDNCMRTYAAFIAKDKNKVIDCVLSGNRIDKQVDNNNKQLRDGYLKTEITKIDPKFKDVYEKASGYIHLSSSAFYQTIVNTHDNVIEFQVGRDLPEKRNPVLVEAADAFIHFVELHFKMLYAVVDSKKRADDELDATNDM